MSNLYHKKWYKYGGLVTNEVITINGYSFGSTQGSSIVTFGGITASIVSWSDTTIEAQVPVGLSSGLVSVEVVVNGKSSLGKLFTVICADSDPPTWDTTIGVQYAEAWGECVCVDCFPPEAMASVYWNRASDDCEPVEYNIYYGDGFNYYESLGHDCGENFQPYDCFGCIWVYSGNFYDVNVRAIDSSTPPNEDTNGVTFFFFVP
ncbi:MAG: IPT/TIG domain-containing protein [Deltaproteobacteria bacterium]|nr:MAG: IPT/TIG domain-containing protein [Deltaproteobacteria bacterium]